MKRRISISAERGFTLVELLMVTVLLSMIVGILYGSLDGVFRAQKLIESQQQLNSTAQYVLSRIIRELSNYSQLEALRNKSNLSAAPITASFGQQTFRGSRETKLGKPLDTIRFVSSSTGQRSFGSHTNYGLVEIEYRVEDPPANDPLFPNKETKILVRQEEPAGVSLSSLLLEKRTVIMPLADNVVSLGFRYRNDKKWEDSWSEPSRKAPQAVEITLVIRGPDDEDVTFKTAVALPSS